MKELFLKKISEWWESFSNSKTGMSGKKLTACVVTLTCLCFPMIMWTISAFKSGKWDLLPALLVVVVGFISSLFAINTWDKKANGQNEPTPTVQP